VVVSSFSPAARKVASAFDFLERRDFVVTRMLSTEENIRKSVGEFGGVVRSYSNPNEEYLWTADVHKYNHPDLKNRIYFSVAADCVGAMAHWQKMTILASDNNNAISFYDNAWAMQPGGVCHIDI
jgi:hypothetical protein